MRIHSLLAVSVLFATVAAQAVELTEDLVLTNQYTAASPEGWTYTVIGGLTYPNSTTIKNARYDQIRPLWAANLNWNKGTECGLTRFYHRDAHPEANPPYVEYQGQSLHQTGLRYVFVRFTQNGDDVTMSIPVRNISNSFSYNDEKMPPANFTLGYKFARVNAGSGTVSYRLNDFAYRIETEGNPNGELTQAADLSVGYSGDHGIMLKTREREDAEYTISGGAEGELIVNRATSYWMITNAVYNEIAPVAATVRNQGASEVKFCHWRDYGSYAEVQVQIEKDGTLNWFFLSFEQDGANVRVWANGTGSKTLSDKFCYGYDAIKSQRSSYSTGSSDLRFNLWTFTYRRRRPLEIEDYAYPQGVAAEQTLSGKNTYTGETVLDNRRLVLGDGVDVLPGQQAGTTRGVVVVTNGAELVLPANETADEVAGGRAGLDIRVFQKGRLTVSGYYALTEAWNLFADDAYINVYQSSGTSKLFFGNMTLQNGACVSPGKGVIRPNLATTTWVSTGDQDKTNSVGDTILIQGDYALVCKTEAPLLLSGGVRGSAANKGTLVKQGSSVLLYSEAGKTGDMLKLKGVDLQEGTLLLCDTFATTPTTFFTLGSEQTPATFVCAPSKTVSIAKLNLARQAGTLEIGSGAKVTVSALGEGWNVTEPLLLVKYADETTSSLVFTPTLTAAQLAHIQFVLPDGKRCVATQDSSTGRIVPASDGEAITATLHTGYSSFEVKANVYCPTEMTRTFTLTVKNEDDETVAMHTEEVTQAGVSSFSYAFGDLPMPQAYHLSLTTSDGDTTKVEIQEEIPKQTQGFELAEDLILTNRFVQDLAAKKARFITVDTVKASANSPSSGLTIRTITNAECTRILPLYTRNLYSNSRDGGAAFFYNRRVYNAGKDNRYVEYQAQTALRAWNAPSLLRYRCAFIRFAQDGENVKVTVPVTMDYNDLKEGEIPPIDRTPGYDVPRQNSNVRVGSDSGLGIATPYCLVWDEDEKNPGGELAFDDDLLTPGYSGAYGIKLQKQPDDLTTEYTQACRILLDDNPPEYAVITNAIYNQIDLTSATANTYAGTGPWSFYHWRDYGSYAEVQAQLENESTSTLEVMFLRLRQFGANVVVSLSGDNQFSWTNNPACRYGYDGLLHPRYTSVANGTADSKRAVINSLTYYRRRPTRIEDCQYRFFRDGDDLSTHVLSGTNTYAGETVVDGMALALTNRANVLKSGSVLVATNGALLVLQESTSGQVPSSLDIRVFNKSALEVETNKYAVSTTWKYWIDDAVMYVPQIDGADGGLFKNITLANGASILPYPTRAAQQTNWRIMGPTTGTSTFTSTGDPCKTNIVAGRYMFYGSQSGDINVEAPVFFQGGIVSGNGYGSTLTKNGPSVLLFSLQKAVGETPPVQTINLNDGTFYLCDEFPRDETKPPTVVRIGSTAASATLACASGTANEMGKLNLGAKAGLIDLGANAQLTVTTGPGTGWDTEGDPLFLRYGDKATSSLFFATPLTAAQRARIRLVLSDGTTQRVTQAASGKIVPAGAMMMVIR